MGRILGTDELYVQNARVAIVVSMFNEQITTLLHSGAVSTATKYGADPEALDTYWVTGAFEIPLLLLSLLRADGMRPSVDLEQSLEVKHLTSILLQVKQAQVSCVPV